MARIALCLVFLAWTASAVCCVRAEKAASIAEPIQHACTMCGSDCCDRCNVKDECCCKHSDKCPCPRNPTQR